MMTTRKKAFLLAFILSFSAFVSLAAGEIHVDRKGVMRDRHTGEEVSYYGVNYTVPFAHAYRALGCLGIDHKEAIDRDVYHFARLGFNAFRIHIWDVEISDSEGNLLSNEHLDLLDYLIAKVEERGISVILTAQTNFGNGYPEKNIDTGAYSYDYWKSKVHEDPAAVAAQERYLNQLVAHVNPYNGKRYCDDESVIAMEINNEPSHGTGPEEVERYINRMVRSMKAGGWKKIILYNVTHNGHCVEGYYNADIQGTTYQWYPMNLVRNSTRHGNYLPFVDRYDIPFSGLKNFDRMAKVVYEFDPADNLYSHLFPAIVRTFRKAGFQWMTQFSYDPIDMAWANTEYQTHYLNLAYTPRKALSMKIAAEAAREIPRGADFGKYPADTLFGDFTVSYRRDLSIYNSGRKYFHTNNTDVRPKDPDKLEEIAGWGDSPVVSYEGTGAYFLDRIGEGLWRLEVMPDVIMVRDPFRTPSLKEKTAEIIYSDNRISIRLPQLGTDYGYTAVNQGNTRKGRAKEGSFDVYPGTYILSREGMSAEPAAESFGYMKINEYAAPEPAEIPFTIVHAPQKASMKGEPLTICATVIGEPDSVLVYPRDISMWNERNILHKMHRSGKYTFETTVIPQWDSYEYNIVAYFGGRTMTWPGAEEGNPLDWDFIRSEMYSVPLFSADDPVILLESKPDMDGSEYSTIPDSWSGTSYRYVKRSPLQPDAMQLYAKPENDINLFIIKHVADIIRSRKGLDDSRILCVAAEAAGVSGMLQVSVVNRDGITFTATAPSDGMMRLDIASFKMAPTSLCPAPYPVFLGRYFHPEEDLKAELHWDEVEEIKICIPDVKAGTEAVLDLKGIWIE